ncbi:MAG: peroxide stress protein YaaA [Acidimicrobiales bacterium]|nr:peroxide stress protein YaaA [Acidimicrobiales bacterium]
MLVLLSPAKSLDFQSELRTRKHSRPRMMSESSELIEVLLTHSPDSIADLMSISGKLSALNVERYQNWEPEANVQNSRPAALAFSGDVYLGMDLARYSERDFTRAQKQIRILSGLYGLLRPLDLIQPYRLEMGTKLRTPRGNNLYQFWGDQITNLLEDELSNHRSRVLVNLASNEYFGVVDPKKLTARVIAPKFLDEKNGKLKVISFYAKRARGAMASWLVMNRLDKIHDLEEFNELGYRFRPELSETDVPVFSRAASQN